MSEQMEWIVGIGIGLFLLFRFPIKVLSLAAVIALVVGGVLGYYWIEERMRKGETARVTIEAEYDSQGCSSDYPIAIRFTNGSRRTVEETYFYLRSYRQGHSSPITSDSYSSDKILVPGETFTSCWRHSPPTDERTDISTLLWKSEVSSVSFREGD